MREKVDELRGVIDAQAIVIAKKGREVKRLERELRDAREELAMIAHEITAGKGGIPQPSNSADIPGQEVH